MQEEKLERTQKKASGTAEKPPALEQAMRWLDRRWYSEAELETRLAAREYPPAEIFAALADCRRYGLVDDARLAREMAHDCAARGQGARRIRLAMKRHGLAGEAVEEALAAVAPEAPDTARAALAVKLKSWSRDDWRKKREKAFRFLAGRGFPLSVIRAVMSEEPALNPPRRAAFGAWGSAEDAAEML